MKRANAFVMLAVFLLGVMSSTVSAAMMGTWVPSVKTTIGTKVTDKHFSSIIGAMATFDGTLQAFSVSGDPNVEEQVFLASEDISTSLEAFNAELTAVYSSLDDEEQFVAIEVYSSLGSYLEDLDDEANQIFQDEDGKSTAQFEVEKGDEIIKNLPRMVWVGSASSA